MLRVAAVDLGASSGRVMLGLYDGARLTLEERHRFSTRPVQMGNHLCTDVAQLHAHVLRGLDACHQDSRLDAVGIDGWAVDFGLVNDRGELVAPPRHYRDPGHEAGVVRAGQLISSDELFLETGIQHLPFNTIYQLLALQSEAPDLMSRTAWLLLLPDLLNFFLTGIPRAEFTNATTTQLVSAETGDWSEKLLARLGLPRRMFPDIAAPGATLGPARRLTAVGAPQVVHVASHDTASAVVAVPARRQPCLYISSGTWSLVGTTVPSPITSLPAAKSNFSNEGGVGHYRLLKNVMGLWILQEVQREWAAADQALSLAQLLREAEESPPFAHLFDPDHPRFLHPPSMLAAIREACEEGGRAPRERGEVVRAILESLVLKYRWVVEELARITGYSFDAVHVVGGGSQNALLSQWTADCLNLPVFAGPAEASAWGNAVMQLVALGELGSLDEARELIRTSVDIRVYEPRASEMWEEPYKRFCDLVSDPHRASMAQLEP
ncbi:rhamnulokinase [Alicyclobacillus vulcanalis]|uniref:Rhamnulokinase n=1 Tax=Alicyclobacillus vulcanalis TaxID=252246 RepID=A0A1N7N1Y2_9BACL|nr:rhamnulokinase family protein [Alicyclobacillus vulcanalis]SIS92387.1 rhamnulokinase [Alicyclobacillus vulcanalis]